MASAYPSGLTDYITHSMHGGMSDIMTSPIAPSSSSVNGGVGAAMLNMGDASSVTSGTTVPTASPSLGPVPRRPTLFAVGTQHEHTSEDKAMLEKQGAGSGLQRAPTVISPPPYAAYTHH